jgi:pimeloyl-ACP methyl ester carboxylesterase
MKLFLILLALGCRSTSTLLEVAPSEELTVCSEGPTDGDPVVLVPGLSGCAFGFRNLTPLLHEQGFRTIIIEPLAVGESSRPRDVDYTLAAQAERLGAVLRNLSIQRAVFVGQGIGGAMVFRLAVERPELVAGFVSVEAGSAEAAISPHSNKGLMVAKAVSKLGGNSLFRDRYAKKLKDSSGDTSWIDRRTVGRYFRGAGRDISAAMDALSAMTKQTEPWALTPRLAEIRIPVVVLLGTAPHVGALTSDDIETLRKGLRDVKFREVPGAGHFIYEEQPQVVAEAVAELVMKINAGGSLSADAALVPGNDGAGDLVKPGDRR